MSLINRVVSYAKANPALAIAGAGVGGVLLLPMVLGRREPEPAAEQAAQVYGPGYGPALTTGGGLGSLEAGNIATTINEGTNVLLGELSAIRRTLATPTPSPLTPTPAPAVPTPAPGGGSVQPAPSGAAKPKPAAPTNGTSAQAITDAYNYAQKLYAAGQGPNPGSRATFIARLSGDRSPYSDVRRNAYIYAQEQYRAGRRPNPGSFATWAQTIPVGLS